MEFSGVKNIEISEGIVKKIEDTEKIIWEKVRMATVTFRYLLIPEEIPVADDKEVVAPEGSTIEEFAKQGSDLYPEYQTSHCNPINSYVRVEVHDGAVAVFHYTLGSDA